MSCTAHRLSARFFRPGTHVREHRPAPLIRATRPHVPLGRWWRRLDVYKPLPPQYFASSAIHALGRTFPLKSSVGRVLSSIRFPIGVGYPANALSWAPVRGVYSTTGLHNARGVSHSICSRCVSPMTQDECWQV